MKHPPSRGRAGRVTTGGVTFLRSWLSAAKETLIGQRSMIHSAERPREVVVGAPGEKDAHDTPRSSI